MTDSNNINSENKYIESKGKINEELKINNDIKFGSSKSKIKKKYSKNGRKKKKM